MDIEDDLDDLDDDDDEDLGGENTDDDVLGGGLNNQFSANKASSH